MTLMTSPKSLTGHRPALTLGLGELPRECKSGVWGSQGVTYSPMNLYSPHKNKNLSPPWPLMCSLWLLAGRGTVSRVSSFCENQAQSVLQMLQLLVGETRALVFLNRLQFSETFVIL